MRSLLLTILAFGLSPFVSSAQITWKRTYGGYGVDRAYSVRQLADDGSIVLGSTGSFGAGGGDVYLFRIDNSGERLWSRTFGGPGVDQGNSVRVLDDGGYVFVGSTDAGNGYDGSLVRTDDSGIAVFEKSIGTTDWDFLHDVQALPDGFLAVGTSYGTGNGAGDIWLVRTDLNGDTLWTRSLGGAWSDEGRSVRATPDGGAVLAGGIGRDDGDGDVVVIKVDAAGTEEWRTELGGDSLDLAMSVALLPGGGYAVGGWSDSYYPERCMYVAKLDGQGQLEWENPLSTADADWEGHEVGADASGNILLAGFTKAYGAGGADFYLLTLDTDGQYVNGPTYGGAGDDQAWSFDFCADGGFIVAGGSESFGPGNAAALIIRTNGQPDNGPVIEELDPLRVPNVPFQERWPIHPNPVSPGQLLTIDVDVPVLHAELLDMHGRPVHAWQRPTTSLVTPCLPSGVHVLRLQLGGGSILSAPLLVR
ncbi:MAG: hypothetical protein KDB75_09815 [Flavobacteriales bacterium]|nr:hypothetical protein [Flavobacteriales bacterium]